MYKSGDWIIDKQNGNLGTVSNVFQDGVTAHIGKMVVIRKFEQITPAPMDIQENDVAAMIDLALATKDLDWFNELTGKTGVDVHG